MKPQPKPKAAAEIGARNGVVSRILLLFLASALLVILLGYLALKLRPDAQRSRQSQRTVRVYCAAGVAKPLEQAIESYNGKYGGQVEIVRTGGSGELAGQIKTEFETGVVDGADLYITADDKLLDKAHAEGIVAERFPLAVQKPVIVVAAKNNLSIDNLRTLVQSAEIKFGVASEQAAIGRTIRQIAKRDGLLGELESNKTTESENVMTLIQAVITGSLDAAVVWDATVVQINLANQKEGKPPLKIAAYADPTNEYQGDIAIGIIAKTRVPTECLKFARYLTAPETGKPIFDRFRFSFVTGDHWEEVPEIHLYFGSMFTPVLEPTVREFAKREGVNIYPRWEGCGKLVAAIKTIEDPELFPDAYLACDRVFLDEVQDYFQPPTTISNNQIVMAVSKNVDATISGPGDLLDKKLRIGICDPSQSALGQLTKDMLSRKPYAGLYDRIQQKAVVTVDVGPTLISQLLAGGLDVAFVYRSNIMADTGSLDKVRIVEIDPRAEKSVATQPWAISKTSANPALLQRFFDWINRPDVKQRFKAHGFQLID